MIEGLNDRGVKKSGLNYRGLNENLINYLAETTIDFSLTTLYTYWYSWLCFDKTLTEHHVHLKIFVQLNLYCQNNLSMVLRNS